MIQISISTALISGWRLISSVLIQTETPVLSSDSLTVYAYVENPVAILSADSALLTEQRLDFRTLIIDLTEERFITPGSLTPADFTLLGAPTGTSVQSVIATSQQAVLDLQFDGTDFDVIHELSVSMSAVELYQTESGELISDTLLIIPWVENPTASLVPDSLLTEKRLDVRSLTITLSEEKFRSFGGLSTVGLYSCRGAIRNQHTVGSGDLSDRSGN